MKSAAITIIFLSATYSHPASGQTSSFQFAWLSDTHIGISNAEEDLRSSVRDINSMDSIKFVILSGDITELGWNAQFDTAKRILDSLNKPYYIIPGNHDTKWSESGCTQFSKVWGSDRFVFEYGGFRFIGLHEGPIMRMGDGHFAPEDLRWMDSVLTDIPNKRQPLFFITHYPLDPQLDNWYEMTERLKRFNTQAVLVGHGHRNGILNFEGISGVMGRSTLRVQQSTGGFTLARVDRDSIFFSERVTGQTTNTLWHRLGLGRRNYEGDTTQFARPNFSVNQRYPKIREEWKIKTGFTIASTPALLNDRIFVGNSSGAMECYSLRDGKKQWTFRTGATVYSSPDIAGPKLVFGSSDGFVYCLNISNGSQVWKLKTGAAVVACPRVVQEIVYIGGSDGEFRAIDLETGRVKWKFSGIGAFVETKPLVDRGKVIFGAWDTYLYVLNASDGSLAWKWSNGTPTLNLSPAACWPVSFENSLFIVAPDRAITTFDLQTGKELFRTKTHQVREALGISIDGSRVYAKCMNDTFFAFSSSSPTARLVWSTDCSYGYDIDPTMPVEKDGVVFFAHKNGTVYALDANTGTIKWEHKVSNTIVNTVAPVDSRRVMITDFDGQIILLENTAND